MTTAEDRAQAEQILSLVDQFAGSPPLVEQIANVIAEALAAERERCAKIAEAAFARPSLGTTDTRTLWCHAAAHDIAEAIRRG